MLLACSSQGAADHTERLARRCPSCESHISILSCVTIVVPRLDLIGIRRPIPGLKTGLLHHEMADRVQVAMTAGHVMTIVLIA